MVIVMTMRQFANPSNIDTAEIIFTFIFAIEIFLRLVGARSWIQFWLSGRNQFDLFLVVATCIIQLPMIQGSPAYKYLTIFQCFRAYRLVLCLPRVRRLLVCISIELLNHYILLTSAQS